MRERPQNETWKQCSADDHERGAGVGFIKDGSVNTPPPEGINRPRGAGAGMAELLWEQRLTNDLLWALLSDEQRAAVVARRSR